MISYGLLCLVMLLAPYLFSGFWPSSYEYWPQALFLALTACTCLLFSLAPESQITLQKSRVATLLVAFFAMCLISVSGTVYLHDSLLEIARVSGVIAWFFLARALLADEEYSAPRLLWLLASIVASTIIVCFIGFSQYFNRPDRVFSTFYNPNLFANYCAMALPLTGAGVLALWRSSKRNATSPAPVICGIVVLAIIPLGLFLTSSKGGFLAALCGLFVFALAIFKAKGERAREVLGARKAVFAIIALLVIVGGGVLFSKTILPRLSANLENDHSTMFRVYTWKGTLKMAAARPLLGFGPGSFPSAYTQFAETGYTRTAHQQWLQIAAENGAPAVLLLLGACGLSTLFGWRALKTQNWIFAAGALGAIAAFFVHGLTDAGWSITSIALLAMIALAIAECGVRSADSPSQQSSIVNRQSSINWLWLLAALPLAFGSWITQRAQTGEDLRTESRDLMQRGALQSAIGKASEAKDLDALSARLWANWAQVQEAVNGNYLHGYYMALLRQPTRALNYMNYAQAIIKDGNDKGCWRHFRKAIELDPNDTEIRWARAQFGFNPIGSGDSKSLAQEYRKTAWEDIEYIAALKDKPYGKYPATPEMVDLNFARAFAMLAQRDFQNKKFDAAKKWSARGLEVIAEGREYEPRRRELEIATYGAVDTSREETMNELESQLKELQEKLK